MILPQGHSHSTTFKITGMCLDPGARAYMEGYVVDSANGVCRGKL